VKDDLVFEAYQRKQLAYYCEICGFGYVDLKNAEACEEFCDSHGFSSTEITNKATRRPTIQVVQLRTEP
jgi:hypothetical protein